MIQFCVNCPALDFNNCVVSASERSRVNHNSLIDFIQAAGFMNMPRNSQNRPPLFNESANRTAAPMAIFSRNPVNLRPVWRLMTQKNQRASLSLFRSIYIENIRKYGFFHFARGSADTRQGTPDPCKADTLDMLAAAVNAKTPPHQFLLRRGQIAVSVHRENTASIPLKNIKNPAHFITTPKVRNVAGQQNHIGLAQAVGKAINQSRFPMDVRQGQQVQLILLFSVLSKPRLYRPSTSRSTNRFPSNTCQTTPPGVFY